MSETLIAQPPEVENDFVIVYANKRILVQSFIVSIFSLRLREKIAKANSNSIEIFDTAPVSTFLEFIEAIHGREYVLNGENCNDLLRLSKVYKVKTLENEARLFIEENKIEKHNTEDITISPSYERVLSDNFSKLIHFPSFTSVPLATLKNVIFNYQTEIGDPHAYFRFLKEMFVIHGKKASILATKLDMTSLSREELLEFLDNENLDYEVLAQEIFNISNFYINESTRVSNSATSIFERVSALENIQQTLKVYHNNVNENSVKYDEQEKRISSYNSLVKPKIEEVGEKINGLEKVVNNDTSKLCNEFTNINDNIKRIKGRLSDIKIDVSIEYSPKKSKDTDHSLESDTKIIPITFNPSLPLHGIIDYVRAESISIYASSSAQGTSPKQLAERSGNVFWGTNNMENQWVAFDFSPKRISVTDYTIKSTKYSEGSCHPKNWVIEGSSDNKNWTILDTRNTDELNAASKIASFHLHGATNSYKIIRLRMTGLSARGDNTLSLSNIEFFGILVDL